MNYTLQNMFKMEKKMLRKLCEMCTDLSQEDIEELEKLDEFLPVISDL